MKHRVSCGIIPIFVHNNGDIEFLLVQGYGNYWGFPKGHKEKGESDIDTAVRELFEETRITCNFLIDGKKFTERYCIRKKRDTDVMKKVIYFIGITQSQKVTRQKTELKNYGWFSLKEAEKKLIPSRKKIINKVHTVIKNNI